MDCTIVPVRHGRRTLYRVGPCFFTSLKSACEAARAAQVHRLDLSDLVGQFRLHVTTARSST